MEIGACARVREHRGAEVSRADTVVNIVFRYVGQGGRVSAGGGESTERPWQRSWGGTGGTHGGR